MKCNVQWEHISQVQAWIVFRDIVMRFDVDRRIDNIRFTLRPSKPSVWRLTNLEEWVYDIAQAELKDGSINISDHYALWRLALKIIYEAIDKVSKAGKPVFTAYDDRIPEKKSVVQFTEKIDNKEVTVTEEVPRVEPLSSQSEDRARPISVDKVDVFGDGELLSLDSDQGNKIPMKVEGIMLVPRKPKTKDTGENPAKTKTKTKKNNWKKVDLSSLKWTIWTPKIKS